jgi:hypothetical protein
VTNVLCIGKMLIAYVRYTSHIDSGVCVFFQYHIGNLEIKTSRWKHGFDFTDVLDVFSVMHTDIHILYRNWMVLVHFEYNFVKLY